MNADRTPSRPLALVTGASGGIGEALARGLAAGGHDLVLVARRAPTLEALAAELRAEHGAAAHVVAADLARPGAAAALAAQLATDLPGSTVDVLVNNAGVGDFASFHEADPVKLAAMLQLNVVALTELTRALVPGMVARGRGRVLNVASTAAFMPGPLMAVYYASKAYVLSFGEAIAHELRPLGVAVTTVCPGPVASGFQAGATMERSKLVSGRRIMDVETCARLALRAMERGDAVEVLGARGKLQAFAPRLLPRRFVPGVVQRAQAPAR